MAVESSLKREEKEQRNCGQGTIGGLLQQCYSLQVEEEGTRRQNNEGVVKSASQQSGSLVSVQQYNRANHLPTIFFLKRNTTALHFYLNLHTAHGVNSSNPNYIGVGFKSIECIYVWNFLRSIGVEAPKLNFQPNHLSFSKKYGPGFHGAVGWGFSDKIARDVVWSLGFPSSHIKDSVPGLIQMYFSDEDPIKLIVFLLGCLAGDGTISYSYVGSHILELEMGLRGLVFLARDDFILAFCKRKLEALGFRCVLMQPFSKNSVTGYINRLWSTVAYLIVCYYRHNHCFMEVHICKHCLFKSPHAIYQSIIRNDDFVQARLYKAK